MRAAVAGGAGDVQRFVDHQRDASGFDLATYRWRHDAMALFAESQLECNRVGKRLSDMGEMFLPPAMALDYNEYRRRKAHL